MLATFESILPIFLLVVAGNVIRRLPFVDDAAWPGLEQLGFYFLYPALLFVSIVNADFSHLELNVMMAALAIAVAVMGAVSIALWPLVDRLGIVKRSQFSSVFQCTVRWNGFMALAIAQKLYPPAGVAVVALVMAVMIIPINIESVLVVSWFAEGKPKWGTIFRRLVTNPLIIGSVMALLVRAQPFGLYGPLNEAFDLVGRAALGMGLIAIGAGLKPTDAFSLRPALWLPIVMKLAAFPVLLIGISVALGISGPGLVYLALCASVPTAMNGFLLARQLGGDAPLYAAITTMQTLVSFFTIPFVLAVAGQLAGA